MRTAKEVIEYANQHKLVEVTHDTNVMFDGMYEKLCAGWIVLNGDLNLVRAALACGFDGESRKNRVFTYAVASSNEEECMILHMCRPTPNFFDALGVPLEHRQSIFEVTLCEMERDDVPNVKGTVIPGERQEAAIEYMCMLFAPDLAGDIFGLRD